MEKSKSAWVGREAKPRRNGWTKCGNSIFSGGRPPQAGNPRKLPLMYVKLFEKLSRGEVKFLVLGGAAVSLHGYTRMTTDIDILLENSPANIERFVSVVSQWGDGCGSNLTYDDFQGPGCVRIEEDFPLDVFTLLNGKPYEHFIKDAVKYSLSDSVEVQCLSIPALIDLKKGTQREKDQLDVTVLQRLQTNPESDKAPIIHLDVPPTTDSTTG